MSVRHGQSGTRSLPLTETEALTLLEMCLVAGSDADPLRGDILMKVADLCRDHMRRPGIRPTDSDWVRPLIANTSECAMGGFAAAS